MQFRAVLENWEAIAAARRDGWLDGMAVSTRQRQRFLASRSVEASFVPVGSCEEYGKALGIPREIDVLFFGRTRYGPRSGILMDLEQGLAGRGIRLHKVMKGCYGEGRMELFNRARIIVNFHNYPWSPAWMRFIMATQCGALMISEPSEDREPFAADTHYVAAEAAEMPEAIGRLLADPSARETIIRAADAFCRESLTMDRSVASLCALAKQARPSP